MQDFIEKEYIERARTIMEALPYIQTFHGKTIVVKYGGAAMDESALKERIVQDFVLLSLVGVKLVIVHGGGPHITRLMERLGKEAIFVEGHRITDDETMEITEMVLSGLINKEIVSLINSNGGRAVGLSGKDGSLVTAKKKLDKSGKNIDFGLVGTIDCINPEPIITLSNAGYTPVVSPVAIGKDGKSYNMNADTVAGAIAVSLGAERLIYLTDIKGIYRDVKDESTFIPSITESEIVRLKNEGVITKGMLPKIDSAVAALKKGVKKVHIIDGRIEHSVMLELLTDAGVGTEIMLDSEEQA
jgi:acetylglutamate kinase